VRTRGRTPQHGTAIPMSDESPVARGAPRRSFLVGVGAVVIGGLAGLVPMVSGAVALLDPLRRKGNDSGMTLVTKLAVLPESGEPRKFTVRADRVDAWTTVHDAPIGSVYLRWTEAGVRAFNVACPHAGCFVGVAPDASHFACPCHKSSFDLDGAILDPASPAPRGMDALEVEVRNEDEVWVRFENFQPGRAEKTPVL
jgi:quinol---cytochrome c reductase iron-sulfur subunit, bacillus type